MALKKILKTSSAVTTQGAITTNVTPNIITLESTTSPSNGYGYLGGSTATLCDSTNAALAAETQFQYDKRLDASTTQDAVNGFGSVAGGIYDTGNSGAFASGKCLRIVENAINVATTLGLQVWAKYMPTTSSLVNPPYNMCYIDPISRLFVLPRPAYWSKCESLAGLTTPEILVGNIVTPSIEFNNGSIGYAVGKFNNAFTWSGSASAACVYNTGILFPSSGMMSYYAATSLGAGKEQLLTVGDSSDLFSLILGGVSTQYYNILKLNGSSIQTAYNSMDVYKHVFIIWDTAKGITGGKSISVYLNNTEILSSTATLPTLASTYIRVRLWSSGGTGADYVGIDNLKIWSYMTNYADMITMEYNAGTGRETALDSRYQSSNNYQPILTGTSGVGYISKVDSPTSPFTIPGSPSDTAATAEAVTLSNGAVGTFGTNGGLLAGHDQTTLAYEYNKRLDASTSEDAVEGYGAVAGGVWDTGTSAALADTRALRIVNNGVNVKSLTGITKVIAKNLSTLVVPPANTVYVDPSSGKYAMPMPIYWNNFNDSVQDTYYNMLTGGNHVLFRSQMAILSETVPATSLIGLAITDSRNPTSWKNNFVRLSAGSGQVNENNYRMLSQLPAAGTVSYWGRCHTGGNPNEAFISFGGNYSNSFGSNPTGTSFLAEFHGNASAQVYIRIANSTVSSYTSLSNNTNYHIYIVWDINKGLSGGKSIRIFVNGVERCSTTNSFTNSDILCFKVGSSYTGGSADLEAWFDNIKIWNHAIDDPAFEYNSGTGRESALHPCYGSTDGYVPSVNTVGYFRSGFAGNNIKLSLRNN